MEIKTAHTGRSIASSWMTNVFLIIAAVIIVLEVFICAFVRNRFYNSVFEAASDCSKGLSMLAVCDSAEFSTVAKEYVEQFEHKEKVEIQIIDNKGRVLFTSNGFEPSQEPMPDYNTAVSVGKTSRYTGKNSSGEVIMASTTVLTDFGSGSNGAVRWVVSLTAARRYVFIICSVSVIVGILLLSLIWFSGRHFLQSVTVPMQQVSSAARKIAMGDFDTHIENPGGKEIGELCDAVNYMAGELKSAEQMKNDFISSVSHELRTPLTAIRGWGETAKMSVGTDEEIVNKGLDVVLSESERLSGLVEELLDFSRMQSGRLSVETMPLPVGEVLGEAVSMYVELARQQGIDLTYLPAPTPLVIDGDRDRLKQVFINIIDNAVKYTEEGGHVIVSLYEEEGVAVTKVNDTGVGIPEPDVDRVKEKFYKANKKVRGSGIGLAVADEIVKQHKGLLFLESKEGVGTTVTVALPLYVEEEQTLGV